MPPPNLNAPTGTKLTCKNWLIEAAYRMIQNNLDPAVTEESDCLVIYGGRGQAAHSTAAITHLLQ
ncbi:MAG: hypothetical protein KBA03_02275 [Anaerolineaceae bacterium]|nr:hypothetical protein [Anaerolineaceae bacterium]